MIELNKIYNEDCLVGMDKIDDKSIDMILCDLPYGTTSANWDTIIPFEPLWIQYKRIIKDNGIIVLTSVQPFTSLLVVSNLKMFKYQWYWLKSRATGYLNAKKQPMRNVEDVCIFYSNQPTYNPILTKKDTKNIRKNGLKNPKNKKDTIYGSQKICQINEFREIPIDMSYPNSTICIDCENNSKTIHPTQKPVALFEYLIKTYTNENDLVLDNCIGSGTTAIACLNLKRNFIGFELDKNYFGVANERIINHKKEEINFKKLF